MERIQRLKPSTGARATSSAGAIQSATCARARSTRADCDLPSRTTTSARTATTVRGSCAWPRLREILNVPLAICLLVAPPQPPPDGLKRSGQDVPHAFGILEDPSGAERHTRQGV